LAVAVGGCQVILAWTECGASGLGFCIERTDGIDPCGPFVEIGEVGPHVTAFGDGSVTPGATYSYRVHAWNASGVSSPSNEAAVTPPQSRTEPPTDMR